MIEKDLCALSSVQMTEIIYSSRGRVFGAREIARRAVYDAERQAITQLCSIVIIKSGATPKYDVVPPGTQDVDYMMSYRDISKFLDVPAGLVAEIAKEAGYMPEHRKKRGKGV